MCGMQLEEVTREAENVRDELEQLKVGQHTNVHVVGTSNMYMWLHVTENVIFKICPCMYVHVHKFNVVYNTGLHTLQGGEIHWNSL